MNRPYLLIIIAIFLGAMLMIRPAYASFSFDETTETTCFNGKCTKTIYSGYSPTFFKEVISKESNWLKFYNVVYLEKDANFDLKILSFNNNSFVVNVKVPESLKNQQIPLKLCNEITNEVSSYLNCSNVSIRMNILERNITVGINPLGFLISFGFNSTTITLNESNSGNKGDAQVAQVGVDTNYGTTTTMRTIGYSSGKRRSFLLWNLSSIPAGSTITNANLSIYLVTAPTGSRQVLAYNTSPYNTTGNATLWNEGTRNGGSCGSGVNCNLDHNITWNNQPSGITMQDNVSTGISSGVRKYWNVTNAAITAFSIDRNLSIMIRHDNEVDTTNNISIWVSKEGATASQRPQLIITYETVAGNVYNATFNIATKESLNIPGRIIDFSRTSNINSKPKNNFIRNSFVERRFNIESSESNSFESLFIEIGEVFERLFNIVTSGVSDYVRGSIILRFFNPNIDASNQFNKLIALTKSFNVPSEETSTFSRNYVLQQLFNIRSNESVNFKRNSFATRLLSIMESSGVDFTRETLFGFIERFFNIPLDLIDSFIVYVRVWEQPSIYQVCSILKQIGDSRAYLCIYDTGEWKILIRGV